MKLTALRPRWIVLEEGGPRAGLSFNCPHCLTQRLAVCFHHAAKAVLEDQYIVAHQGADGTQHIWTLNSADDFETMTLQPSIDASKYGHWHGWITGGEIK